MKSIDQRSLGPWGTESDTRATAGNLAALAPQGESFLAIETLGAFVIDDETFGFEHIVQDRGTPARA